VVGSLIVIALIKSSTGTEIAVPVTDAVCITPPAVIVKTVIVASLLPPVIVITFPTAYPVPALLIVTDATAPNPSSTMSTVNPVPPDGETVVATPVVVEYPVPPTSVPASKLATLLIGVALSMVIVASLVGVEPPRLVPTMVTVSAAAYPLPGVVTVTEYVGVLDTLNTALEPPPDVVPDSPVYVWVVPMIAEVNAPLSVTTLPVTSVTLTATPSPRSKTNPGPIPVVLVTDIVVAPMDAFAERVVDAATPPPPVTAVICDPVTTPVPDNGAPIGGALELKPIAVLPEGVVKLVVIVPELPLVNTLNDGDPTADPV
jgi:hypothetical protein